MSTATVNKTYLPEEGKIERKVYIIDAKDKILGKIAAKAAHILRGKHKTIFSYHLDTGDTVVIINAAKFKVTGKKMKQKEYQRYSGYPSGQKTMTLENLLAKAPTEPIRLAVHGMIPHGRLGDKVRGHLKIYKDENHPHAAQKPIPLEI